MQKSKLTVFFDGLFWIGIYERIQDGKLEACKITFGAEPKDYEVYGFILKNWHKLRFSPLVDAGEKKEGKMNPKRMQRNVAGSTWDRNKIPAGLKSAEGRK